MLTANCSTRGLGAGSWPPAQPGRTMSPKPISASAAAPFVMAAGLDDRLRRAAAWQLVAALRRSGARRPRRRCACVEHRHPRRRRRSLPRRGRSLREERGAREPQVGVSGSSAIWPARRVRSSRARSAPTSRSMSASTLLTKSTCSAASAAASRPRAATSAPPSADADAVRVAIVSDTVPRLCRCGLVGRADRGRRADRRVARPVADADRAAASGRPCKRARHRPHRRASRPAAAEIPPLEAERQAALFRLATLTGRTPRELPARGRGERPRPYVSTSRFRSAMARRCSPGVRTFARPSGGSLRRRRGSGSRPPIFIRGSRSAGRSGRAAPASAMSSAPTR